MTHALVAIPADDTGPASLPDMPPAIRTSTWRSLGKAALLFMLLPVSHALLRLTGRLCRLTLRLAADARGAP